MTTDAQVHDMVEKGREGMIQSFNGLFKDFKDEIKNEVSIAVENQIKITVNGKIDAFRKENQEMYNNLMMRLDTIKKDTDPVVNDRNTITSMGKFVIWGAGIAGAITGLYKLFKL